MKKRVITLSAIFLIASLQAAFAGDKEDQNKKSKDSWKSSSSSSIQRVDDERLEEISTAKDLIGASLYDTAGEKVGDVVDVSVGVHLSQARINDDDGWFEDDDMNTRQARNNEDRYSSENENSSMANDNATRRTTFSGSMSNSQHPYLFVSVGGIMGIADDLVRIPLGQIRRSAEDSEDLVLVGSTKEQVVAIAERDPVDFELADYENDSEQYGRSDYDADDESMRAKRSWSEPTTLKIRTALATSSEFENFQVSNIEITEDDDKLVLSGTVDTKEQKRKAAEIAEEHSSLDVENNIKVKK